MGLREFLAKRWQGKARSAPGAVHVEPPPLSPSVGFAVFDVETTGLDRNRDRIVEIAVVRTDRFGVVQDTWTTLLNPRGPVGATHIHGISERDVRHAPSFHQAVGTIAELLAGRALVAHNAVFDLGFLAAEFARAGIALPAVPHLCTLQASEIYQPNLDRRRLVNCCWAASIQLHDAHSALGDAQATAALLRAYLASGRVPSHHVLPDAAARFPWPVVARSAVRPVTRRAAAPAEVAAAPGRLAALLDDLPLANLAEGNGGPSTTAYLELVAQVLEDGVLTEDEAAALYDLAQRYQLTRERVADAHRAFVVSLANRAVEDGVVTRDERDELTAAARALGVEDEANAILTEAENARRIALATETKPLPTDWRLGEPFRIGQSIAFTGCEDHGRDAMEERAQRAGLLVRGVSRRSVALVTDDVTSGTGKARKALELGTRIVTPAQFAVLIEHVQPELAEPPVPKPRVPVTRVEAEVQPTPVHVAEVLIDPAVIRAWARRSGHEVAVRGRVSAAVRAAYLAAIAGNPPSSDITTTAPAQFTAIP